MILYKKTPFPFKMKNIMMLDVSIPTIDEEGEGNNECVVYVSKNTYDQCVRLHGRLEGELGLICRLMSVDYGEDTVVNWFHKNAPEPVNMLAPFLGLLQKKHEIEKDNIEQMFGYLHILSQIINFDNYTLMPAEARADISVGNAVLKSYKESWSDLEQSLVDRIPVSLMPASVGQQTVQYMSSPVDTQSTSENNVDLHNSALFDDDSVESEDDFVAMMNALVEQATAEAEAETSKPQSVETTTSTSTISSSANVMSSADAEQKEAAIKAENERIADQMKKYI